MLLKLLIPISQLLVSQPLCEAAAEQAKIDKGTLCPAGARITAGWIAAGVQTGTVWTIDVPASVGHRLIAAWIDAGAQETGELAPWTEWIDPRAIGRTSWRLVPATGNPYGLPVHLIPGR
jgi:hypothetical protein